MSRSLKKGIGFIKNRRNAVMYWETITECKKKKGRAYFAEKKKGAGARSLGRKRAVVSDMRGGREMGRERRRMKQSVLRKGQKGK